MALFARLMCTGGATDENDDVKMDRIDEMDDREGNKIPKMTSYRQRVPLTSL